MIERGIAVSVFTDFCTNKEARILDVGSGDGSFLVSLAESGYTTLYSIDIENNLKDDVLDQSHVFRADLSFDKIPLPNNSLDIITAWQVVEHLENPHNFIREAYRTLEPGGYFLVSIPNPFHLISRLLFLKRGNMPRWTKNNNHLTIFTKDLFQKAFLQKYFDLIETRYHLGEFTYGPFKLLDGKYPENEWFGHFVTYVMRKK